MPEVETCHGDCGGTDDECGVQPTGAPDVEAYDHRSPMRTYLIDQAPRLPDPEPSDVTCSHGTPYGQPCPEPHLGTASVQGEGARRRDWAAQPPTNWAEMKAMHASSEHDAVLRVHVLEGVIRDMHANTEADAETIKVLQDRILSLTTQLEREHEKSAVLRGELESAQRECSLLEDLSNTLWDLRVGQ